MPTPKMSPFVRFNDGKCREAMNFYKDALGGGELDFMVLGDSPIAKDMPKEKHSLIMHSTLKKGDLQIIGSDMMRDVMKSGDQVGISLEFASQKELNAVYEKLSVGGDVFMAPEPQFWGAVFGLVTDKYGVEWMLNSPVDGK